MNKRPKSKINTSILADNLRKGRPLVSLSSVILSSTNFQGFQDFEVFKLDVFRDTFLVLKLQSLT